MKIEISIEKDGEDKPENGDMSKTEITDEQKRKIGEKLKRNMTLTRMERKMLAGYLLEEED
jgi:hypothetical protein